ncbi:MAG: PIN domain-containing protein [Actinobacteria bacterium]|nr:PIN domain-containing protein [Actinomycetota bacterium]
MGIWAKITVAVASELIRLECMRTIDRARIRNGLDDDAVADHRGAVLESIEAFSLIKVGRSVLERAAEPFPTVLGSLDAIHLASALLVQAEFDDLSLATHDPELAIAARAVGLRVYGSPTQGRSAPRSTAP